MLQPMTSHQLDEWLLRHACGPPTRLMRMENYHTLRPLLIYFILGVRTSAYLK